MNKKNVSGNWTTEETNLFCEIVTDPITNFMITLERKALKKSSRKEVFEEILGEFQARLLGDYFKRRNSENLKGKKKETKLLFDVKRTSSEIQQYQITLKKNI